MKNGTIKTVILPLEIVLRIRRALKSIKKHRCFYYSLHHLLLLSLLLILQYFFLLNVTLGNPVLFSNVLRTTRHNVNCYVSSFDCVKHITLVALVALYRLYVLLYPSFTLRMGITTKSVCLSIHFSLSKTRTIYSSRRLRIGCDYVYNTEK